MSILILILDEAVTKKTWKSECLFRLWDRTVLSAFTGLKFAIFKKIAHFLSKSYEFV